MSYVAFIASIRSVPAFDWTRYVRPPNARDVWIASTQFLKLRLLLVYRDTDAPVKEDAIVKHGCFDRECGNIH
ncbi:hypothetical protein RHS01_05101 [Rhizoctonia solani]|uniref:Uncharacterized protein n=1 Tax=Rhizoctonia solani TaxID=456999 RepID=A0A8H7IFR3_9AGAM|nr:hypothetical protein RHS01_05101 [Rhizoctonia solani]